MMDYAIYCKIHEAHHKQGLAAAQIAREMDMDVRTVARWLAEQKFRQRKSVPRPSKLDPFKKQIVRWLESHPYTATQIFQRLRESGYGGGISIVKDYVHQVRPPQAPAFLTLAFAPGECAQVDWGQFGSIDIGNTRRRLSFFVMVLCHSRMLFVQFTPAETMEHFLDCHANAFAFFGGTPARVMVDNLRSAVLQRITGQAALLNPRYKDLADHYGFEVVPCGVGQPQEKGRVENAVGYIKKNFLAGRDPGGGLELLNTDARQWLDTVANVRIHGTTHRQPTELFAAEKPCLKPLPIRPYDVALIRPARANSQFRVTVDSNTYSVPAEYASAALTLKLYPDCLCVYQQDKLIARHVRRYDRHQDFEDPDHPRALLQQRRRAADQKLLQRLLALSPRAESFYQALAERQLNVIHHVRKIVALSEIYGVDQTARGHRRCTGVCGFQLRVHRQSPRTTTTRPARTGSIASDSSTGPARSGTARTRHRPLQCRPICPERAGSPAQYHSRPQFPRPRFPEQPMSHDKDTTPDELRKRLDLLKLPWLRDHVEELARQAADGQWSHAQFLARLLEGELAQRQDNARARRIREAGFPVLKTLEQFDFTWPMKINRQAVQNLFRLNFIREKANAILIGGVGLGKTHLAVALGHAACEAGMRVRFTTAIDVVNVLSAAHNAGRLAAEIRKYTRPHLLVMDELGYIPIDKHGADLLFQVISQRYECGSIVLTTNKVFKHWPAIFNNDATLTSAILDRILHHAQTIVIEGKSYRMKDRIEP